MPTLDPRIDAYIAKSADFARPILTHLRGVVHPACPEVEETIKWSMPHFQYKGMLCAMSAFKAHCAFSFWQGAVMFPDSPKDAMGHFGRITCIGDLPPEKELVAFVKQAMKLNDEGAPAPGRANVAAPRELATPEYFIAALAANPAAQATFEAGSPSFKREYVDWIVDAKTEVTRGKRMVQAIEWLAEGKSRNWKYAKC